MNDTKPHGLLPAPLLLVLAVLLAAGASAFAIGLATTPARAWAAFLVSGFYALALSLGGALFVVILELTGAEWSGPFARVPEAMARALPWVALPFALLLFGMHHVYHWAHHGAAAHDAVLAAKAAWLNVPGFAVRLLAFLALWSFAVRRLLGHPAAFALLFAPTFSLACVDWLMSVEPHWSSTLYPWYVFVTLFAGGLAALTLLALPEISKDNRHDLGKLVFAFSFFWGYLWYCQYMLIWYANIPEEVTHYVARTTGVWFALFVVNALVNFVAPFLALLSAHAKKATPVLAATCALVVVGHWIDVHMLVMPAVAPAGPALTALDAFVGLGFGSLWLLAVHRHAG